MKILKYIDWRAIALFGVVGPPLGEFAFFFPLFLKEPLVDIRNLGILFTGLPFAYIFGFFPAILAGLLFGIALRVWPRWLSKPVFCAIFGLATGILGSTVASFGFALLSSGRFWNLISDFKDFNDMFLTPGGFSGIVCSLILLRARKNFYSAIPADQASERF